MKPIRVGITAVGSGIGQSIVHSCRLSSLPLHIVGYDVSPFAYGTYDCHECHHVPSTLQPDYPDQLLERCLIDRLDVLIPGLDLDLPILAEQSPRFEAEGIRVLVGGLDFVRLSRDKRLWGRTLNPYCPHILAGYTPDEALEALHAGSIHFPLIAKPVDGSASAGVRIIKTLDALQALGPDIIVQPFAMPGSQDPSFPIVQAALDKNRLVQVAELSYQWLVSKQGEILGQMATRHRLKDGVPIEIIPVDPTPHWEALFPLIPFLKKTGMWGPVNFQGRMTEDGPRFFEMNARFTGITGLRAMFGFNEVDVAIRDAMGFSADPSRLIVNTRRVGLRQVAERIVSVVEHPELRKAAQRQAGVERLPACRHILVTGATGWLGRHLVNALLSLESVARVYACVRSPEKAGNLWPKPDPRLSIWDASEMDIADPRFAEVDALYHLAAARSMQDTAGHAADIDMTRALVAAAAQVHLPRFFYLSSQSVYGLSCPPPWLETLPPAPMGTYGLSKCAGEQIVSMLPGISRASRATSLRIARLYGAADGLRLEEVPHKFAHLAVSGEDIRIQGGQQAFDLIHIEDAVRALLALLDAPAAVWAPAYNVGSGTSVNIVQIAEQAMASASSMGRSIGRIDIIPSDDPPMRFGMVGSAFTALTGWRPSVTLSEGMEGLVRWMANTNRE